MVCCVRRVCACVCVCVCVLGGGGSHAADIVEASTVKWRLEGAGSYHGQVVVMWRLMSL